MGSKYPPSVRGCLPLWALTLEAAFILVFFFFTYYDTSLEDQKVLMAFYQVCQDLTVMAALGLGFLTSSLRRHSWSSVAFNLFMLALGVQWAILLDGFLSQFPPGKLVIKLSSIRLATMSAMSVLISAGAVLGKVNLVQLVVMVLVELTAFVTLRMVSRNVFSAEDHTNMMCIHVFAAYFGLTVAWCLPKPLPKGTEEKERTATCPSLSAMLGTLFLWMFWPSFNSALLRNPIERRDAVFNTYYALVVSAVTSISVSSLAHPQGKINMTYMHNAVLAGGVAVGASCHLISSPWLAMVLGLVAGLISIGGAKCLPVCFNQILGIHDSCGVHYTFGLPGLLGQITYIVLMMHQAVWANAILYQVLLNTGLFSLAMAMGLASGLLTGLLLSLKIWKGPHAAKYFDDQAFWEFPHLAVGF
ncbi:blood group Rh(CE) polypeptide isoform X1 [Callithrix jacchus]|uniref:blood group Rh(CE) polypeptide isoform X1 n=3 Tax=Callithrix jacchus TaxID=9483 RepID=UPI000265585B|nr:blood group Rh(CE) polypeptide isoform X1 [Callithrix jacchus]